MKTALKFTAAACLVLALSACVAGTPSAHHAATSGALIQFLLGLWNGFIAPFTLIGEIINKLAPHLLPWTVKLYEAHDTGVAYDIGFYIGMVGSPVLIVHRGYGYRNRRV